LVRASARPAPRSSWRMVNPAPRCVDRSTVARLDAPGPTGSGEGQGLSPGPGVHRVGVFGERQRARIARLASAGTRLAGVARGGRWTVGVSRRWKHSTCCAGRRRGRGIDDARLNLAGAGSRPGGGRTRPCGLAAGFTDLGDFQATRDPDLCPAPCR
jgi:hypothetical protein